MQSKSTIHRRKTLYNLYYSANRNRGFYKFSIAKAAVNMVPMWANGGNPTGKMVAFPRGTHIKIWKVASYGCYMGNQCVCNMSPYMTHVFAVYNLMINLEWYSHIVSNVTSNNDSELKIKSYIEEKIKI